MFYFIDVFRFGTPLNVLECVRALKFVSSGGGEGVGEGISGIFLR